MRAKAVLLTGACGVDRGAGDASLRAVLYRSGSSSAPRVARRALPAVWPTSGRPISCSTVERSRNSVQGLDRLAGPPLGGELERRCDLFSGRPYNPVRSRHSVAAGRRGSSRAASLSTALLSDSALIAAAPVHFGSTRSLTQRNRAPREDESRPYFLSAGRP
jgi:hypothetical protein